MNLTAVTVCVNFADYLNTTMPINRKWFDRWVVVTEATDLPTITLAGEHDCEIVLSERYKGSKSDKFNKGKMINSGLDHLRSCKGFLCHIDADVALPMDFGASVTRAFEEVKRRRRSVALNATLFGAQRLICNDPRQWKKFVDTGEHNWRVDRVRTSGNPPPGYLQIWSSKNRVLYPENHPSAGVSDIEFGRLFRYRHYIDRSVVHLENRPDSPTGRVAARKDHGGRTSPLWRVP